MQFRHANNVYFRWCIAMRQRKVQGFCGKTVKILALEQRIIALKALACKGFCVVQYTLYNIGVLLAVFTPTHATFSRSNAYRVFITDLSYGHSISLPFWDFGGNQ